MSLDTSRRRFVRAALSMAAALPAATLSFAGSGSPTGRRFVFVILRGGMDGLTAVPAIGEPDFEPARGALANFTGFDTAPLPLEGPFALHPLLAQLHAMYRSGELLVVHAAGLPYRERSHFDAQQVLESGGTRPYELSTGWLGRALAAGAQRGIAINTAVPLVLRGPAQIDSWAPSALPEPNADLVMRLQQLYAGDPALAQALQRAKSLHTDAAMAANEPMARGSSLAVALARKAGEFLARPDGPQAAVLEMGGWDSHANQAAPGGALSSNLRALDAALAALRDALRSPASDDAWSRSVAVVATEFGREVAINGTLGTDHGSGGAAFVLGGAVRGGRVLADWPGLGRRERFEGRDLRITTDLRAVLKPLLAEQLRLSRAVLEREVFPGSGTLRPLALLKG
ncbi:MAG TPA: DUF1501 domain-containing protein [Burkholderiaceae bacterium]|jgi:uncharacterized protein (DUF1501 family)|nr:DUF1501 domain-containing protein [Burkholderiaceae bacterium]